VTAPLVKHGRTAKTVSTRSLKPGALLLGVVTASGGDSLEIDLPHGLRTTVELDDLDEETDASALYVAGDFCVVAVVTAKPLVVTLDPAAVCQFQTARARPGQLVVGRVAGRWRCRE